MENYNEYLIQGEPDKRDRIHNWMTAIGLQNVDGPTPSNYMLEIVRRTTSVFTIQYLKHLGFKVNNEVFEDNSRYSRNALIRANYSNIQ